MNAITASAESDSAAADPRLRRRTPGLLLGPFYPLNAARAGSALWRGDRLPTGAQVLVLDGRVLNLQGEAVVGAEVELWQADPAGRYRHPSAPESDWVLESFAGYGRVRTTAAGTFTFTSLVPGVYTEGDALRAPHLHLQITGRFDRLVTQLFLPDHPGNAQDRCYRALVQPDLLTPTARNLSTEHDGLHLQWTAVVTRG